MKGLINYAIESKAVTYFVCALLLLGGVISFFSLGQLEDPVFSVKTAVVVTQYPGASPEQVEMEVTDRIEKAIQEIPQLKDLYSISRAGESIITVDIKPQYWSDQLPQVWDELRKKVRDVATQLPPESEPPKVMDDFGFVYGFLLAMTGEGFTYEELEDYAEEVKKELNLVKGVSRVELWGVQPKVVYVDVTEQQLAQLNLTSATVLDTLQKQNVVVDAGSLDVGTQRFRMSPTGAFTSPEEIGDLVIRAKTNDIIGNVMAANETTPDDPNALEKVIDETSSSVIRIKDVANVYKGYKEPPLTLMRYNGKPAIGIQIAGMDDANIVTVGQGLYARLEKLMAQLPIGIEIGKIAWQSDLVSESVNSFLVSLVQAIIIVLIVLVIPSGFRMGAIVGIDLILTILGTFIVMAIMQIPLQRMSLGALIIALGMMVDNSIVVSDGIAVRFREGMNRKKAAAESAMGPAFPLFAATIIAVMAFYPIYASAEDAGEYCRTLFIVVAAALTISWLVALLITPLQCMDMLPEAKNSKDNSEQKSEYDKPFYRMFRKLLTKLIKFRFMTMAVLVGMLMISFVGFGFVSQLFFPDSSRPQLMIDFWGPEGERIEQLSSDLKTIEDKILESEYVENVSTFIGAGPPRFYLPVDPEKAYPNYAQLVVTLHDYKKIPAFLTEFEPWITANATRTMVRFRKYGVGPSNTWKFEARVTGPNDADLVELRSLGDEILNVSKASSLGRDWKLDMMNRRLKVVPEYDQKRGRWSAVTRTDIADALKRGHDGVVAGLYREQDHLLPIVFRNVKDERKRLASNIGAVQVKPDQTVESIPLLQVVKDVLPVWEDPLIIRWNRRRSVTVQGTPVDGVTYVELKKAVIEEIDKVKLPTGYELEWFGEEDSTKSAQKSLLPGVAPAVVAVLLLLVMVFNDFRPIYVILLTIPFAAIGVTWSLLIFDIPFGFLALLGAMSLAGMMNKNIVVLLDACNENLANGMSRYDSIIEAAITRVRPVLLAAGTTVLGVIPLLSDVFWVAMAVTIMGGLAFGSILTLVVVPVLYSIFYNVKEPVEEGSNA
ncbi:MAG: efflux RND transporter permease subunit [Chlamydiota bacterium]|nr:efflux RND transporter permease subunit [Chlamydiota bacterium]